MATVISRSALLLPDLAGSQLATGTAMVVGMAMATVGASCAGRRRPMTAGMATAERRRWWRPWIRRRRPVGGAVAHGRRQQWEAGEVHGEVTQLSSIVWCGRVSIGGEATGGLTVLRAWWYL